MISQYKLATRVRGIQVFGVMPLLMLALLPAAFGQQEWVPEGPSPIFGGQVENVTPDDEVNGAIHTVVAHPSNPDIIWIGGVNSGIWKTENATATNPTWVRQTDSALDTQRSLSIGALDLDPTDGTSMTLVAGIGRNSSFLRIGGDRIGILRTTDGGDTWTPVGNLTGSNISGIASRGTIIVAASNAADAGAERGLFRSTNSGGSFTQIAVGDGTQTGLPGCLVFDLVGDPSNNSRLFLANGSSTSGGVNGIYRSDDTGATWTRVSDSTIEGLMAGSPSSVEMAVGNSNNVYVAIANGGRLAGVFRSGNGGTSWTRMDTPAVHPGGQASLHMSIVADPTNANIVYIGGDRQPSIPSPIGNQNWTGNLVRCDATAGAGSQCVHLTHRNDLGPTGGGTASNSAPHADSREMTFDAAGNLLETDDGGIYRRTSPLSDTGDWFSILGNIQGTEHHDIAFDANAGVLLGGAQDNGSESQNGPGDIQWVYDSSGDGGDVAVDDTSTPGFSTHYLSAQNLQGARRLTYNSAKVLQSSTSMGLNVISGPALSPSFVNPIELNALDPTRLLIYASNGTYESFDQGDTLTSVSTAAVQVFDVIGHDPVSYGAADNINIIYAAGNNRIYVRTGAPGTPLAQSLNYPGTLNLIDISLDPDHGNTAFVVDSSNAFITTDAGSSWTDITGNLASLDAGRIHSNVYVPSDDANDAVVLGTDRGVYIARENDGFNSWSQLGTGMPNAIIMDLDFDRTSNTLFAGTMGRGSWSIPIEEAPLCPLDLTGDGVIDQADLDLAIAGWNGDMGDVNGNGLVEMLDLLLLLNGFGSCP